MDKLDPKSLILDISVNFSRIGRFLLEEKYDRAHQFITETKSQLSQLSQKLPDQLEFPVSRSQILINQLSSINYINIPLIDDCFTYSTLLQHRSNLLT